MPTMYDIRNIVNNQGNNTNKGTLQAPLFILLIGEAARKEERNLRTMLKERWSNSSSYLHIVAIQPGRQDAIDETSYTINQEAIRLQGERRLYWAMTEIIEDFLSLKTIERNSTVAAIVCGEDESALWVVPALCILNDRLYELGGSVASRSVYVYLSAYHPRNKNVLNTVKHEIDRWTQARPDIPMRSLLMPDGTYEFQRCDGSLAGPLITRAVCLAESTNNGKSYDKSGGRNSLACALIDPQSGIHWQTDGRLFSAFIYPDEVEQGVDVAVIWKKVHERFTQLMDTWKPNYQQMEESINKPLYEALDKARSSIAKAMQGKGFCIFNDVNMQTFLQEHRGKHFSITPKDMDRLFGISLSNKFDYLWRQYFSSQTWLEIEKKWRTQVQAWINSIWALEQDEIADCHPLRYTYKEEKSIEQSEIDANDKLTAKVVCVKAIENYYSARNVRNGEVISKYLNTLNAEISALLQRRCNYLLELRSKLIPSFNQQISNTITQYINEYTQWVPQPNQLIQERESAINIGDALDGAYASAINHDNPDEGLMGFLNEVAEWLASKHFAKTPIPQPTQGMWTVACSLKVPVPTDASCEQVLGGRDEGRYYFLYSITTLDNIREFG